MKIQKLNESIFKPIPLNNMIRVIGGIRTKITEVFTIETGMGDVTIRTVTYKVKDS